MSVYFRFKHSIRTESIPIPFDDLFITVEDLTNKIIEAKKLTRSNYGPHGLIVTDPVTNEDFVDERTLIRRWSTVLVRKVPWPGWRQPMTLVVGQQEEDGESSNASVLGGDSSGKVVGGRRCSIPGTPAPPEGYVCHRCRIPGHFIQYCPTNKDRDYDIKRVKPSSFEVSKEAEAAFDSGEMEGLPSKKPAVDLPPELHCPLCKQVLKYAMFTSKCCFETFCDQCIREYVITKSMCVCGAADVVADYLIPNQTVRDLIISVLNPGYSSGENSEKNGVFFCFSSSSEDQKPASKNHKLSPSSEALTIASEPHEGPTNGDCETKSTSTGKRKSGTAAAISTEDQNADSKKQKLSLSSEASTIASETHGGPNCEPEATSIGKRKTAATTTITATSDFESNDGFGHFKREPSSNYNFLSWEGKREQTLLMGR